MWIIVAFSLSLLFIIGGVIGIFTSTNFGSIAWLVMAIWPGVAGFVLAALGLGIKWIPVLKVASPYFMWLSCIATLSVVAYALGNYLISAVWK